MIGEYYVSTLENGDQYLYIVPSVYNKIGDTNEYQTTQNSVLQIYAQLETIPRDLNLTPNEIEAWDPIVPQYDSWSCNMIYDEELKNRTVDDLVEIIFYEGDELMRK